MPGINYIRLRDENGGQFFWGVVADWPRRGGEGGRKLTRTTLVNLGVPRAKVLTLLRTKDRRPTQSESILVLAVSLP